MFDLDSITLTNFRSYLGTHKFEFPKGVGLYYFTGKNLAEPALGANGAGKSTLLDAITWVLFGRTTRGLKANEILPWDTSVGCSVVLELTIGKHPLQVKRTQKPNGLFLNDKPVDQEELQTHIRLNFDSFKYSVLNAQFEPSFFALQPSAKLTLFSDIMELDFWLEKSDAALKLVRQQDVELEGLRTIIARHEGQIASIDDDIAGLGSHAKTFEAEKAVKLEALKKLIKATYREQSKIDGLLSEIEIKKSGLLAALKDVLRLERQFIQDRDDFLDKIAAVSGTRSKIVTEQKAVKESLKSITGINAVCPCCLQHVDQNHLRLQANIKGKALKDVETSLARIDKVLGSLTEEMIKAKLSLNAKSGKADDLREEISDLDVKWTLNSAKLKTVKPRLDELAVQLDDLECGENPYSKMIADKKAKLWTIRLAKKTSIEELHQLEATFEATKYWVKGFKRVRLFIIEQAFKTLEIEVNNSLAQLGMTDWQVTFDVERENKSGGITKGFVVFIKSPANNEPVRWENWSGGETQRLQLAGDLGLANLIMQQNGLSNTIEFFDEPSTHLSPEGMFDLANMLHDRAIAEGKRIWIVDHASITNFGEFKGIITAEKTENGSSITYSTN